MTTDTRQEVCPYSLRFQQLSVKFFSFFVIFFPLLSLIYYPTFPKKLKTNEKQISISYDWHASLSFFIIVQLCPIPGTREKKQRTALGNQW
jgi:hypothetical protein